MPVFTRGAHPIVGVGFTFNALMPVSEIRLPFAIGNDKPPRRTGVEKFRKEIEILQNAGIKQKAIADMCGVDRLTIYRITKTEP